MSFDPSLSSGYSGSQSESLSLVRNRVLRNAYLLLAASLIPTVLGAVFGMVSGLQAMMVGSPIVSLVIFMLGSFFFLMMVERNKNSSKGVMWLMIFTFFMGVMLSKLLGFVLSKQAGTQIVATAFGGTAFIFFGMAFLGTVIKKDLSTLGKFLSIGMLILFGASLIGIFFPSSALYLTVTVGVLAVSSLFIMYQVNEIVRGGETNYIMATLSLYISVYNVFQTLLTLLGVFGGDE
jgi:modulator of FtsH protease